MSVSFERMKRLGFSILFFCVATVQVHAQHEQVWLDFQLDYPFGGNYLFEVVPSYQTVLSKDDKWRSMSVTSTFEYYILTRLDLTFDLPISYTLQKEETNSFGLDPTIGARFHITQNKRVDTQFVLKIEERLFYEIEAKSWNTSSRIRPKVEAKVSINRPNLFTDKLWYGIFDFEEFFVLDQQLDERYANRRRTRAGLGYRYNYKNRFEFVYTRQTSKNEIDDDFVQGDNIFLLKYKYYINPSVPAPVSN